MNLPLYPAQVHHVVGVELSERMLDLAHARVNAAGLGKRVELRQGDVEDLDFADGSFDAVVSTYTICRIPNPPAALSEAWRVLRPQGRLILVEHGPAARGWVAPVSAS